MNSTEFVPDDVMDSMSAFLNLPIEPEYRKGIAIHLRSSQRIAKSFLDIPLDDETEPAPVFVP
jgi:Protein of unknown function (DUF4089)